MMQVRVRQLKALIVWQGCQIQLSIITSGFMSSETGIFKLGILGVGEIGTHPSPFSLSIADIGIQSLT